MKNFILSLMLAVPVSAFSQSYMVLNNRVALTTDAAGFVYDFNHQINPYEITVKGGRYFIEAEKLITIDLNGILYKKDVKVKGTVKGHGGNYFFNEDHNLYTVDALGFHYITKDKAFKKVDKFGGNFFTVINEKDKKIVDLYSVTSLGAHVKTTVPGLNPADITTVGSRFLITNKGAVYTTTKDGIFTIQPDFKITGVKKNGGNFFLDSMGSLYTISELGKLSLPILPMKLLLVNIAQVGSNYMLDLDGRLFVVDMTGSVWERDLTTHDTLKAHDLRSVFVTSK
ncbi:MAG TPA: hypothetical protein VNJ01_05605 [Bacteriovoracaceae bacterium]|nr:hypothetical protein [Bacteriovoracaceae bacterium]